MDADAIFLFYPTLHRTTTKDCGFYVLSLRYRDIPFVWQWFYCILYYLGSVWNEQTKKAFSESYPLQNCAYQAYRTVHKSDCNWKVISGFQKAGHEGRDKVFFIHSFKNCVQAACRPTCNALPGFHEIVSWLLLESYPWIPVVLKKKCHIK